jgi:hypothetical protein
MSARGVSPDSQRNQLDFRIQNVMVQQSLAGVIGNDGLEAGGL